MDFSLKQLAAATLMMASLIAFTAPALANITPQQSEIILKSFSDKSVTDFRQFLTGLAKSDLALGSRYAELVDDKRVRHRIFGTIEAEWHRTVDALNQITTERHRLASNPGLARSIRHRFPYIDPLHHLQLELIRRYRLGHAGERVQRGIHLSINGISAALRNTG